MVMIIVGYKRGHLGTVDIINTALRTHQRSQQLREVVGPIIARLIPVTELRDIAARNIAIMRESIDVRRSTPSVHRSTLVVLFFLHFLFFHPGCRHKTVTRCHENAFRHRCVC